ncbi:MAG: hypothetical protein CM1200mP26_04650 [Acidimicrobiales bacterium]|nr:MAG: hypothetical protein CM1200mP26_04650 [Acidimicrobiales bacterium]
MTSDPVGAVAENNRQYSTEPFYGERDGLLVPGPLTGGPWDPTIQHGGPISGILAHLVETVPVPGPMRRALDTPST